MKATIIALAIIFAGQFSQAIWPPKGNRVVYTSQEMNVVKSTGYFGKKKNIEVQFSKSFEQIRQLSLIGINNQRPAELETFELVITNKKSVKKIRLLIDSIQNDSCGTRELTLYGQLDGLTITATLLDHTARICEDYRPYVLEFRAEAYVSHDGLMEVIVPKGELIFQTNIQPIYYIM